MLKLEHADKNYIIVLSGSRTTNTLLFYKKYLSVKLYVCNKRPILNTPFKNSKKVLEVLRDEISDKNTTLLKYENEIIFQGSINQQKIYARNKASWR